MLLLERLQDGGVDHRCWICKFFREEHRGDAARQQELARDLV
jgi:hypothetical protein